MASRTQMGAGFAYALASCIKNFGAPGRGSARLMSCFVILSSLLSLGFGPVALTESDAARMRVYPFQLGQLAPVPPPELDAKAAVIMDFATGRILYEKNAHMRVAPASTTKMMTALVAVEQGRLSDKVTIQWKHLVGWASMGLRAGDVLTVEDLLWGMLLPSANEAAEALADHVGGGSADNFVKMMNDKAAELGLKNTQFKNPHGLDEEGHYSSAHDLAVIARTALQNPLINRIAATGETTIYASRVFRLVNSNSLMRLPNRVPGIDGFKTGYTGDAGDCLVATATRHGHRLITVAMGAVSRNEDSIALLNYGFEQFVWETLPRPAASRIVGEAGQPLPIELPEKREVLVRPWEKWWISLNVKLDRDDLSTPWGPSALIGFATYSIGGAKVTEYPLRVKG